MKLITATRQTQGQRPSDYTWCVEGEIVMPNPVICGRDEREGPDGGCGCGRAWCGLNSSKGTTTAMVREIAGYTIEDLTLAIKSSLEQSGWHLDDIDDLAAEEARDLTETAAGYPEGAVLETRMGEIAARRP